MKNVLTLVGVFLFSLLNAQESTVIAFDYKSGKISYDALKTLQEGILNETGSEISNQAIVRIYPSIKKSSSRRIEGMESKSIGSSRLNIKIYNNISQNDTLLSFEDNISGVDTRALDNDLVAKALNNSAFMKEIKNTVTSYITNSMRDCSSYKEKLTNYQADKKLDKAINLIAMLELNEICSSDLKSLKESILTEYNKTQCESIMHQCKVLIANGNRESISKATRLLLMAPPSTECRAESLKIIEELNTKTNLNYKDKAKLGEYNTVIQASDYNSWYRIILDN